jgi:hypothetical protein
MGLKKDVPTMQFKVQNGCGGWQIYTYSQIAFLTKQFLVVQDVVSTDCSNLYIYDGMNSRDSIVIFSIGPSPASSINLEGL